MTTTFLCGRSAASTVANIDTLNRVSAQIMIVFFILNILLVKITSWTYQSVKGLMSADKMPSATAKGPFLAARKRT
jgi:preprotein translocase subunit SecG